METRRQKRWTGQFTLCQCTTNSDLHRLVAAEHCLINHDNFLSLAEDAIDNPVYQETEMSENDPSPVRGIKYTPITSTEMTTNGLIHSTERSLADDNPLYASSALEKILNPGESDATNTTSTTKPEIHQTNGRAAANGHAQSNGTNIQKNIAISTLRGSSSLEHILMTTNISSVTSQKGSRPPALPMKSRERMTHRRNSLPHGTPQEAVTSFLVASQSLDNLLQHNTKELDPYGEYGDRTIQRVASKNVVSETAEGVGKEEDLDSGRSEQIFDNPDYEFVDISGSGSGTDHPTDLDYEEI